VFSTGKWGKEKKTRPGKRSRGFKRVGGDPKEKRVWKSDCAQECISSPHCVGVFFGEYWGGSKV